jgi:anti-anti-sigma factor
VLPKHARYQAAPHPVGSIVPVRFAGESRRPRIPIRLGDRDPPERLLEIENSPHGLRIVGEVDLSNAAVFADAVRTRALEGGEMMLDLSRCRLLSSEAIDALIAASASLGPDGRLILRGPSETVRRVLELGGLGDRPNVIVEPQ